MRTLWILIALLTVAGASLYVWAGGEIAGPLLLGWVTYPAKTVPKMGVNRPLLGVGLLAFILFLAGTGWAGRRLFARRSGRSEAERLPQWTWRSTLGAGGAILLLFMAGVAVVGGTHQAVWLASARGNWHVTSTGFEHESPEWDRPGRQRQQTTQSASIDNLRRIGVALEQYHQSHGKWPSGIVQKASFGRTDWDGDAMGSWIEILVPPELIAGDRDLFGFPPPLNRLAMSYWNPAVADRVSYNALTGIYPYFHYAGNRWVFPGNNGLSRDSYADHLAQTLLVGEVVDELKTFGDSAHLRDPLDGINSVPWGFGGPAWQQGAQFLLGDGSVRQVSKAIDPAVLRRISVPPSGQSDEDPFEN